MEDVQVKSEPPSLGSEDRESVTIPEYVDDYHAYCIQYGYHSNDTDVTKVTRRKRKKSKRGQLNNIKRSRCHAQSRSLVAPSPERDEPMDYSMDGASNHKGDRVVKTEPVDELNQQSAADNISENCDHQGLHSAGNYYVTSSTNLLHSIKQEAEMNDSLEIRPTSADDCSPVNNTGRSRKNGDVSRVMVHRCTFDGCNKTFKSPRSLATHTQYHTMDKKYACTYENCSRTFISRANLSMHLKSHLMKEYVCDVKDCGMKYKLAEHLEKHKLTHKPLDPLACPRCAKRFPSSQMLKKHVQTCQATDGLLPCQIEGCGRVFKKLKALLEHQTKPHGPFICTVDDCGREFQALKTLKTHIKITHCDGLRFICEHPGCGRGFKVADSLRKHMISHSSVRNCVCSQCGAAFKYKHSLKKHMAVHDSSIYKYHCPVEGCQMAYHTPSELRNHHERKHTNNNNWTCEICGKTFKCQENYMCHVKTHADKSLYKYVCPSEGCGMKFRLRRYLRHHMVQHEIPKGPFTCLIDSCSKVFWRNIAFEKHIINHTNPVVCPVKLCKKLYKNIPSLRRHISQHLLQGENTEFNCTCPFDGCLIELHNMIQLKEHITTCHSVLESCKEIVVHGRKQRQEVATIPCSVEGCDCVLEGYHSWLGHLCCVHAEHLFKLTLILWPHTNMMSLQNMNRRKPRHKATICDMCGKVLSGISSLKRHIAYIHVGSRPFICPVPECGKSFKGQLALQIHANVHSSEHKYKCKYPGCGKRYKNPNSLSTHKRTHYSLQRQRHVCPHEGCDKVYASDTAYRCHLNTHTNPGCNKCSFCGKTLADANSLARHVTMHTAARSVVCVTCGKSFYSDYYLKLHKRYHAKKKKYRCVLDGCQSAFYYPCNLKNHLSTMHGVNMEDYDQSDNLPDADLNHYNNRDDGILMMSNDAVSHVNRHDMLLESFPAIDIGCKNLTGRDFLVKSETGEA